jgi:hypothetical protein
MKLHEELDTNESLALSVFGEVVLDATQKETLAALVLLGYLVSHMVTFAVPLKGYRRNNEWLKDAITVMMTAYFKRYHVHPQWTMVMNRGWHGNGDWSAHVVWKNEIPEHMVFFTSWWNKRFGSYRAKVSTHDDCLAYYVKNMGQPDAHTYEGPYNRRNTPNRGKGYRGKAEEEEK